MTLATSTPATDSTPIAVSVVVPTCGRLDLLERCLDALTRQTLPGCRYEVIIVDDEPNHNTLHLVAGWRARTQARGPRLLYVSNAGPHGPAAARNRGWRIALGGVIAFTDDDTVACPTWLASGLQAFDAQADAVSGRIEMPLPAKPTDHQRDACRLPATGLATGNFFCRKSVLERLQGFDERFTAPGREVSDLYFRLLGINATIRPAPQALVVRPVRPAPWGVSLLQVRKMAFDALLYKKHPGLYREKIGPAARHGYYTIVGALLLAIGAASAGLAALAILAAISWLVLTARMCAARLAGTARTLSHVAEVIVTSALIPPLAVFWRIAGAIRYRVRFT